MNVFKCELKKIIEESITYYPDFIVSIFSNILLFFILFNSLGNKNNTIEVYGYILWIITSNVLSEIAINISSEKQLGTLQNLMVKPNSIMKIMCCKSIGWFIINLIKVLIIMIIFSFFIKLPLIYDIHFLYIIIITSFGILGLSLILGALTLIYTKIASFEIILNYLLLFLSGSFIKLPNFIYYTNPLSLGSKLLENLYNNVLTFNDCFTLMIISSIYFIIGYSIFKFILLKIKNFNWKY